MEDRIIFMYRLKKVLKFSALFLLVVLIGFSIYEYIRIRPYNVKFTNITSNSVTVSWNTKFASPGSAILSDDTDFLPITIWGIGKEKYYDTRDMTAAELEAAKITAENLSDSNNVTFSDFETELMITDMGSYYTHHVTVTNLEPEKKYSFKIGDSLLFFDAKDEKKNDTIATLAIPKAVLSPRPAYGSVKDASENSNVPVEDLKIVNDGIVYISFFDEATEERSNIFSSSLNESGNWYVDISSAVDSDGSAFLDRYEENITNIYAEITINAGQLGTWKERVDFREITPVETSILNIPNVEDTVDLNGVPTKVVSESLLTKGVMDSKAAVGSCLAVGWCNCGNYDYELQKWTNCDSCPEKENGTFDARGCKGSGGDAQEIVNQYGTCGGKPVGSYSKKSLTECVECKLENGSALWKPTAASNCGIEDPEEENNCTPTNCTSNGKGGWEKCVDGELKTFTNNSCTTQRSNQCQPTSGVGDCHSVYPGFSYRCVDGVTKTYNSDDCFDSNCASYTSCTSVGNNTWKKCINGEVKSFSNNSCTTQQGSGCQPSTGLGNCNNPENGYSFRCENGVVKSYSTNNCTSNDCSAYASCTSVGNNTWKKCVNGTVNTYYNSVCTQTTPPSTDPEVVECDTSYWSELYRGSGETREKCVDQHWVPSPDYYASYGGQTYYSNYPCVEGGQCKITWPENRCVADNGKTVYVCNWFKYKLDVPGEGTAGAAVNVKFIYDGDLCSNSSGGCICNSEVEHVQYLNNGEYCQEIEASDCDEYKADGKVCSRSSQKQVCANDKCVASSNSGQGLRSISSPVLAEDTKMKTTEYILDSQTGMISGITEGLYSFENNGETYAFLVSASELEKNDGKVLVFIDKNGNSKFDESEDVKVSELASKINVSTLSQRFDFELKNGFNFISLPFLVTDTNTRTAASLLTKLNSEYNNAFYSISKYNGSWKIVGQNTKVYDTNDFQLIPGEGYIIKANRDITISISGQPIQFESDADSAPILLNPGWNLVGLYGSNVKSYTAKSLIQSINSFEDVDFTSDNVSRWQSDKQMYEGYQLTNNSGVDIEYGFDFPINLLNSYFVKVLSGSGNWEPEIAQ